MDDGPMAFPIAEQAGMTSATNDKDTIFFGVGESWEVA